MGDEVDFEVNELEDQQGIIKNILPRKNYIVRKSINLSKRSHILAANIDHVYLIVTLIAPETTTGFIDRFLVTAEAYHIPVTLLFNKVDIFPESELDILEDFKKTYTDIGYRCINISAINNENIAFLKDEIDQKKVMFGGHSGVGKSTLVNALDSSIHIKTKSVSSHHLSGQHTTTFAEMHKLVSGGYIIDTPGIRAFGLIDFDKNILSHYFPEMSTLLNNCKFSNCQHINEPNCSIKNAVENGEISQSRYHNYVQMHEDDETENFRKNLYK